MDIRRADMTRFGALALGLYLVASSGVSAEPEMGCFARDYSDAHLASNPAQVVDQIVLRVGRPTTTDIFATIGVTLANQGHVAASGHGGQSYQQFLFCWRDSKALVCGVECDGGSMTVTRVSGDSITFRTNYLIVGNPEGCGGFVDLAEFPGQPVSYRLDRVSDSVCEQEK